METILLEVDKEAANAWNNSSPSSRAAYEDKIIAVLKEFQETEQIDEEGFTKAQRNFLEKKAAENIGDYEWWKDDEMMAELDKIESDMISGKAPRISIEESKARLTALLKKNG